jgi:hypothetical protein
MRGKSPFSEVSKPREKTRSSFYNKEVAIRTGSGREVLPFF